MAKGPIDIGEENMALNQEDMASNQETTEPNRQPRDRKAAETEAARLKGQETRRRNYEKRMEKQRLAALAAEEQRLKQRKRDEGFMREALRQAKKAAAIGDVPIGCVIVCGDRIIASITGVTRIRVCCPMLKLFPLKRHVKRWETGVWRIAPCM